MYLQNDIKGLLRLFRVTKQVDTCMVARKNRIPVHKTQYDFTLTTTPHEIILTITPEMICLQVKWH